MYSMWTKVLHLFETSQMKRMLKVLCQVAIPYKINLKKIMKLLFMQFR